MDEHRSNPFRRGPRGGSSPDRAPDRAKRGRGPARPEGAPPKRGLRKLPADLHDLAEGRVDRLRSPRRAPEPRAEAEGSSHVVPGVRNSEARAVYDRRVERLRAAAGRDDTEALELGLYDAQRLALWRARNVTDFDAFAEHVVGLRVERARQLAAAGAARSAGGSRPSPSPNAAVGPTEQGSRSSGGGAEPGSGAEPREAQALSREFVALWLRSEATLMRICPTASVRVVSGRGGKPELELRMPAEPVPTAVEALRELGPALTGLAKLTSTEVPERARPRR